MKYNQSPWIIPLDCSALSLEVEREDEGGEDSAQHEEREPGLEERCPAEG